MIIVHTLTRGTREQWLRECVASVAASTAGATHIVARGADFTADRWSLMTASGEFVGFVDDDDTLVGDPISACAQALRATGAGIAFTWDRTVDPWGATLRDNTHATHYEAVAERPYVLRQFALVRRECISDAALLLARTIGAHVLDLALKAQVAFDHCAVQVPMIGYARRQHAGGMSRNGFNEQFKAAVPTLRQWYVASAHSGAIPLWP